MKPSLRLLSLLPLLAAACGLPPTTDADEGELAVGQQQPVIVGTVNWSSSTTLSGTEATRARAVGYLSIPAVGSRCTAWLVSADVLITNNHCISSASQAAGARVSFNYEDGVSSTARVWYDCPTFLKTWASEDMTALRCNALNGQLPGNVQGFLTLAASNPVLNQNLYVVHQNCDYYTTSGCTPNKKYSPGVVKNPAYDSLNVEYDADTLGGSSGSPVLAKDGADAHKVIALHHWGFGGNSSGRGTGNGGVKVSALRTRLAEIGIGGGTGGGGGGTPVSFSYSASNTNSAQQNTTNRTVPLTAGQRITVATCGVTGASFTGDTYLRLASPAGALVAGNDDACGGRGSSFTYSATASGNFTIRAGCYGSGSCSGTVVYTVQ
jgi:V8-like Glu-specific endopeptidase